MPGFGSLLRSKHEQLFVICPKCGAGYKTEMILTSILADSPFMADLAGWRTKVVCRMCRNEIWVSGSHGEVHGRPKPG